MEVGGVRQAPEYSMETDIWAQEGGVKEEGHKREGSGRRGTRGKGQGGAATQFHTITC